MNEKLHFMHGNKVIDRAVQALDISRSFLNKILKEEPVELNEKSVNKCKDFLDSFDKDIHVIELLCYNWRFFIDVFDACFYCLLMFSFCLFQY